MTSSEKRIYLIRYLLNEKNEYENTKIPNDEGEQRKLLRSLFNLRMPKKASPEFIEIQNEYLREEIKRKGITDIRDLSPVRDGIYIFKGDITTLKCDAVVNAANSAMLGCFYPCHGCIDNAIHTYSGIQLRESCARIMRERKGDGQNLTIITKAYNLPSNYVIHTVGPIVTGSLMPRHTAQLALCYSHCLELAVKNGIKSIAFCCISTGEFHFPNEAAAQTAVETVTSFIAENKSEIEVIFNVFKRADYEIYKRLLG